MTSMATLLTDAIKHQLSNPILAKRQLGSTCLASSPFEQGWLAILPTHPNPRRNIMSANMPGWAQVSRLSAHLPWPPRPWFISTTEISRWSATAQPVIRWSFLPPRPSVRAHDPLIIGILRDFDRNGNGASAGTRMVLPSRRRPSVVVETCESRQLSA